MEIKLDLPVHLLDGITTFDPATHATTGHKYYPYCEDDTFAEQAVLTRTREKVDCPRCIKLAGIRKDDE